MDVTTLSLADGDLAAVVDVAAGARLTSLHAFGSEVLVTHGTDLLHQGCFPMAPYAGRVREGRFEHAGREHHLPLTLWPHAAHGTVLAKPWQVVDTGPSHAHMEVDLGPAWPFPGRATHRIELVGDELHATLEVHADDEPFPASCGWHPWFRRTLDRGTPAVLHLEAGAMWERGADGLPTGALVPPPPGPWDDCFTELGSPPGLEWPGALSVTLRSASRHVVVYDEPEAAVCIEPQTAPPDALNLCPELVHPGAPLVASVTFAFRTAEPVVGRSAPPPART